MNEIFMPDFINTNYSKKTNMKFRVKTHIDKINETIDIEESTRLNDLITDVVESRIDLKDKAVREALIKLGWTPPCK
jgi:hypothetical protein